MPQKQAGSKLPTFVGPLVFETKYKVKKIKAGHYGGLVLVDIVLQVKQLYPKPSIITCIVPIHL